MAGRGAQSFKKRQKEQQRKERQEEKRARRFQKKFEVRRPEDEIGPDAGPNEELGEGMGPETQLPSAEPESAAGGAS